MSLNVGSGPFLKDEAAMAIDDTTTMWLMDAMARTGGAKGEFEWDTVPLPVDPNAPG